jgi:type IV secretory pathway VirB2 component (pilin)
MTALKVGRESFNNICRLLFAFTLSSMAVNAYAQGDFDIGEAPTGPLEAITAFFQDIVNFLSGPALFAVGFISLVLVVMLWVFAPKLGPVMFYGARVAAGVIILVNLPLWYTYLGGSTP